MASSPLTQGLSIGPTGTPLVNNKPLATPSSISIPQGPYAAPQSSYQSAVNAGATGSLFKPPQTSSTGGLSFNPALASGYNNSASIPNTQNTAASGLSQFVTNNYTTPNGGTVTMGSNGQPTGFTPGGGYSIDTSGPNSSSTLNGGTSLNDVMNQQNTYADYVNALAQAQGYSPQYIAAQQGVWTGQANQAGIAANIATGVGTQGLSTSQAATLGGQQQALNTQYETGQQIALSGAQLARTGQIAAAQTQLQYSPEGMSGQNAINQYNTLQEQYPGANIPAYNPSLSPEQNQQIANQLVAQSGAYQAGFQATYTTPGGGTGIYSKLNVNSGAFQQNADGTYTLVPAAAAALGTANASIVSNQLQNLGNINSAISSSGKTVQSMTSFMTQYGLNQGNVPITNQIANAVKANLAPAGAIAALQIDLNTLQSDYAQLLIGRGGSVAGSNQEAADAIPNDISPAQLQTLYSQMQQDGLNTAQAVSDQVNEALQGISTNSVQSTSGASNNTPGSFASGTGWN